MTRPSPLERAVPLARVDSRRQHLDAVPLGVLHDRRRRVKAHRLAVDERRRERGRVMHLAATSSRRRGARSSPRGSRGSRTRRSPGSAGRGARRTRGDARCPRSRRASRSRCRSSLPLRRHAAMSRRSWSASPPCTPRPRWRSASPAPGRAARRACARGWARASGAGGRPAPAVPAPQVRMHHPSLDRPRAHDRHLDDEVVEAPRPEARQHRHLRAALDLEDADRVGRAERVVNARVLGGDRRERSIGCPTRGPRVVAARGRAPCGSP